jgi:DNA repair exonuclease SbcCD ATPase subunit
MYTIEEDAESQFDEGFKKFKEKQKEAKKKLAEEKKMASKSMSKLSDAEFEAQVQKSLRKHRDSKSKSKVKSDKKSPPNPRNLKPGKYGDDLEIVKVVTPEERTYMARQNAEVIDDIANDEEEVREEKKSQLDQLRALYSELSKMKKDFSLLENALSDKNKKIERLTDELSLQRDENLSNLLKLSKRLRENHEIITENENLKKLIPPTPKTGNRRHPGYRRNERLVDEYGNTMMTPSRTPGSTTKHLFKTPGTVASKKKRRRKRKKTERKKK